MVWCHGPGFAETAKRSCDKEPALLGAELKTCYCIQPSVKKIRALALDDAATPLKRPEQNREEEKEAVPPCAKRDCLASPRPSGSFFCHSKGLLLPLGLVKVDDLKYGCRSLQWPLSH